MCGGQVRAFRVRLGSARQTRGHNSKYYFASNLRIEFNSRRRFAVVLGYAILSSLSASRTIWETINRAFSLSSAGTTYQGGGLGACRVQASLISLHVMLPVFPLVDVREAEFPILVS